mmetsp:Transcript_71462/g.117610  ORF Transcript_71462/g.117610 Transcript_71462/m.117610 type:complete len:230 (-) Transcript_71462:2304-2993(-)
MAPGGPGRPGTPGRPGSGRFGRWTSGLGGFLRCLSILTLFGRGLAEQSLKQRGQLLLFLIKGLCIRQGPTEAQPLRQHLRFLRRHQILPARVPQQGRPVGILLQGRLVAEHHHAMPCSCNGHIHGVGIRQQAQFAAFLRAHGAQQDIVPFAALGRGDAATMDLGQTFLAKEVADLGHLAVVPRQHRHGALPQLLRQPLRQRHRPQRLRDVGAGADAAGTHGAEALQFFP